MLSRWWSALIAVGLGSASGLAPPAAPAVAQACPREFAPAEVYTGPTIQRDLLAPQRVWETTRGAGITVAVIDTGMDDDHPQLAGAVEDGWDLVVDGPDGTVDCDGHGTSVASVIAAREAEGIAFAGIAPGASILPVRAAERGEGPGQDGVDPNELAEAIRIATDRGAAVIAVSFSSGRDTAALASSVAYARERDVLVVATAGVRDPGSTTADVDQPVYPAGYPEVLGVAGIDAAGTRLASARVGSHVDLVAVADGVVAASVGGGHTAGTGNEYATAIVAGTAALVRAAHPELSAAGTAARLVATADRVPDAPGLASDRGAVNPYRAVTEVLAAGEPRALPPPASPTVDPAAQARAAQWNRLGQVALGTALAVVVAIGAFAAAAAIQRQRERVTVARTAPRSEPEPVAAEIDIDSYFEVPAPPGQRRP